VLPGTSGPKDRCHDDHVALITEDRMLRAGLPGSADCAARMLWRLIPGIW
jgi:hypothetical protein